MKSLSDKKLLVCCEDNEVPMFLVKNLTQDLMFVFKRYVSFNECDFDVKIKILKGNKYMLEVKCLTDFLLVNDNF